MLRRKLIPSSAAGTAAPPVAWRLVSIAVIASPPGPYFAFMCLVTDLPIAFHFRRSSARASASTRRAWWAVSRWSFRQLS